MVTPLLVARDGTTDLVLRPEMANRHGLITGATGTGKTVTLQALAERFSAIGVPVFLADVKGDLSGLSAAGSPSPRIKERLDLLKLPEPSWSASPVVFWDVFGEQGHPVRATISEMGPLLLGRLLELNETQQGVLTLAFKVADDNGLLLLDLKDLKAMLQFVGENAKRLTTEYGNVSAASVGAIQRGLLALENQGAERFFGEPALDIHDLIQVDRGRGVINVLAADKLLNAPKLYATFLLWLLSELFEDLPEVGDAEKPKLVFFFDEAHLLFKGAPAPLLEKVEQVVRLIRSKGVGVFFVTQNPLDVPQSILGQLGNRVQHALRAFTPRDQKAVKAAAETLRPNPALDAAKAITELGVGEALVSMLDEKGSPGVVRRGFIVPPSSKIGPISADERRRIIAGSVLRGHYETMVDRESAYEKLMARTGEKTPDEARGADRPGAVRTPGRGDGEGGISQKLHDFFFGTTGPRGGYREGAGAAMAKSAARTMGTQLGRAISRGLLGSIFGKGK
jgi:uncharacterized protein